MKRKIVGDEHFSPVVAPLWHEIRKAHTALKQSPWGNLDQDDQFTDEYIKPILRCASRMRKMRRELMRKYRWNGTHRTTDIQRDLEFDEWEKMIILRSEYTYSRFVFKMIIRAHFEAEAANLSPAELARWVELNVVDFVKATYFQHVATTLYMIAAYYEDDEEIKRKIAGVMAGLVYANTNLSKYNLRLKQKLSAVFDNPYEGLRLNLTDVVGEILASTTKNSDYQNLTSKSCRLLESKLPDLEKPDPFRMEPLEEEFLETEVRFQDQRTPETYLLEREQFAEALKVFNQVTGQMRQAFWLNQVEGLPESEVAKRMEITIGSVRQYVARARAKIDQLKKTA